MPHIPIEEKYELQPMPLAVGGRKLEILTVKNLDPLLAGLDQKEGAAMADFPFWVKIWEASLVLTDHLANLNLDQRSTILEIGAGMGITGLVLGALGHDVTLTDYVDDALSLLSLNARHNGLDTVKVRRLDWNAPDLEGTFDVICGAELIYSEQAVDPVIGLLGKYLNPGGAVYLAHEIERKCMIQFIGKVPGRFDLENRIKTLRGEGEAHRIVVHTLRVKG